MPKLNIHGTVTGRMKSSNKTATEVMLGTRPDKIIVDDVHNDQYDSFAYTNFDFDVGDWYWKGVFQIHKQITSMWDFHEKELELERFLAPDIPKSPKITAFEQMYERFVRKSAWAVYGDLTNKLTAFANKLKNEPGEQYELDLKYRPSIAETIENYQEFYQSKHHKRKKGKRRKYAR